MTDVQPDQDPSATHVQRDQPDRITVPDIRPFDAEPLLLARLAQRRVSPLTVTVTSTLIVFFSVSYAAALTDSFYPHPGSPSVGADLWHFLTRSPLTGSTAIPYLRDYPSLLLTLTITASVPLVYGLFTNLAVLHRDLDEYDCVRYDEQGGVALLAAVEDLNARIRKAGRLAPLAVVVMLVGIVAVNLALDGRLFPFAGSADYYADWWARLSPIRLGGVVWVLLGTIGLYMVYVEAIVGVYYVRFLRECRIQYRFRANPYNPDGFYGWSRLRKIFSNMEAGVVCSALTVAGMFYFLEPSLGGLLAAVALAAFMAIVLYVFIGALTNLRRQVAGDRKEQTAAIIAQMPKSSVPASAERALEVLAGLAQLEMLSKVPGMPIRKGALLAGGLSLLGPLAAIVGQLLRYFLP